MRQFIDIVETQKPIYFLRDTANPQSDLKRGFSCHTHGWCSSEEEARKYQKKNETIRPPLQDPISGNWCADPELGLSSFAFWDEISFSKAMEKIESYAISDSFGIAVFTSSDYEFGVGADGEDVFRDGCFLGRIKLDASWEDILNIIKRPINETISASEKMVQEFDDWLENSNLNLEWDLIPTDG